MDTLAVRLAVPLIGPAEVFHLLGLRPAGRTNKRGTKIHFVPLLLATAMVAKETFPQELA